MKCLNDAFFFFHFFDPMAILDAMKIHTAIVPITTRSGIFPIFLLNFLLFNYLDKFFKFFSSFFLVSLKQEIKISTIMRGEIRPVVCLIRNRLMILFVVISRHNYKDFVRGLLSASP